MGSKQSRHNSNANEPLSKATLEELCQDTGFTEEELLSWHTNFYKDCPDGKLTLKKFEQEYSKILGKPTQKTFDYVKHMFNVYDQDKNQFIDFKEFVMALSAASVVNRLRLVETLFSVFDLDNDGKITKDEMGKMLDTLADVVDSGRKRQHHPDTDDRHKQSNIQKRLDDAFAELNANDDDHITKDEFIDWYMKTGLLSDVKPNEINLPDTSRIQQLDKKSRKIKKHHLNTDDTKDDNHQPHLARFISHMTEQKTPRANEDGDDDDVMYNDDQLTTARRRKESEDSDSHYSKENDRWQHLFNSVLGQIRAQRLEEKHQQEQQPTDSNDSSNQVSHFSSWKKHGAEKLKIEYYKQKSTDNSATSDVVSIRF